MSGPAACRASILPLRRISGQGRDGAGAGHGLGSGLRFGLLLAALGALTACAAPSAGLPRSDSRATVLDSPALITELSKLAAAGRHAEVVRRVELALAERPSASLKVRLELARAGAYQAMGRTRSAQIAWQRAYEALPGSTGPLPRATLLAWGDGLLRMGRHTDALYRYEQALDTGHVPPAERDDIAARAYLALREAGRSAEARRWRDRIQGASTERIAALERQLLPARAHLADVRPTPLPGLSPGVTGSWDDPRAILPGIHLRSQWGAAPVRSNVDPLGPLRRLTVHHSAMVSHATGSGTVAGEIRQIQSNHQNSNRWADIGYHFIIDAGGSIWEARPLRYQGAHEGTGLNQGAVGICLLGNFQQQPLPVVQAEALRKLLDALLARASLSRTNVVTHQEVRKDPTACPGPGLQAWVDGYRRGAAVLAWP